jgi:hypothetical protein
LTKALSTGSILRWLAALAALQLVLAWPDRLDRFVVASFLVVPAELPLIVGLYLAMPARFRPALRAALAVLLALVFALKCADIAMQAALGRRFQPLLDLDLVAYGLDLAGRALGPAGTALALGIVALLLAGLIWLAVRLAGRTRAPSLPSRGRQRQAAGGLVLAATGGLALPLAWPGDALPLSSWASRNAAAHVVGFAAGAFDRREFAVELAGDPVRVLPDNRLFAGLHGRDVFVVFVESYGRSVVDPAIGDADARAALAALDGAVTQAGLAARSAWLSSPVVGGQSWLAHATLLSGLEIDSQRRYETLTRSDRATLVGDFARAGWRTVAVMPALTDIRRGDAWFGHDKFYRAGDLGYRGAPFNWVTMPDQYTLATFAARELDRSPGTQPVFAEIALISSHAPWTPIPPLLPWASVGDGSVFTPYAAAGDPPAAVWRDPARVRAQYRRSIAYVLHTLAGFVAEHGKRDMLIVIVGDHPPAPFAGGDAPDRAVPVHLIAGEQATLAAFAEAGWAAGAVADLAAPLLPMAALRGRLVDAFTPTAAALSARANGPGSAAIRH